MSYYKYEHKSSTAWISEDGSWSSGNELITFDGDLLTDKQWELVAELPDSERINYIVAILDEQDLTDWEEN